MKQEAFEIVSSNSPDQAGEKHEWLKQTDKSIDPPANIKIQNESNTGSSRKSAVETKNSPANLKNTNSPAVIKNTSNTRESAVETKNSPANGKTEFSKPAGGSMEKSVEKTHSSKFDEDPKHLEIVGSSRNKIIVDFSAY